MEIDKKQIIKTLGKEDEKTVKTILTSKREKFLSKVGNALEVMSSITTDEDTVMDNTILKDLIRLENSASSRSVSLSENCDLEGKLSSCDGFIVIDNPKTFAHRLN